MASVILEVGGNRWTVACRDGEEEQLKRLGAMIAERWPEAQRAAGEAGTFRIMLMAALMLADDLADAQANGAATASTNNDGALAAVADRLEALAAALEDGAPSA